MKSFFKTIFVVSGAIFSAGCHYGEYQVISMKIDQMPYYGYLFKGVVSDRSVLILKKNSSRYYYARFENFGYEDFEKICYKLGPGWSVKYDDNFVRDFSSISDTRFYPSGSSVSLFKFSEIEDRTNITAYFEYEGSRANGKGVMYIHFL